MKRGFTIVELLGVLVILSLLMLLIFPNVIDFIKKANDKIDDGTLNLVYNASDLYIENHILDFPKINGNKYVINLNDLKSENLLPSLDIKKNSLEDKCVQVTYQDKYEYELKNIGECEEFSNS